MHGRVEARAAARGTSRAARAAGAVGDASKTGGRRLRPAPSTAATACPAHPLNRGTWLPPLLPLLPLPLPLLLLLLLLPDVK
jgi:hypothetical protein